MPIFAYTTLDDTSLAEAHLEPVSTPRVRWSGVTPDIAEAVDGDGVIDVLATTSPKLDAVRFRGEIDVQRIDDNWIAVADFDEAGLLVRDIDDRSGDLA